MNVLKQVSKNLDSYGQQSQFYHVEGVFMDQLLGRSNPTGKTI